MDLLSSRRRAAIKGCAGSGKTMLAVEKARRLASQGFNVLLTCFNTPLAEDLSRRISNGVTIINYHGLCKLMTRKAGYIIKKGDSGEAYFDHLLPDALLEAIDRLGPQYDAVIVDEGQDFKENWWLGLVSLLKDPDGILYVFYDDNQNLYKGIANLVNVIPEEPFGLIENCRNTQGIHKAIIKFHPDGNNLRSRAPLGRPPEIIYYRNDNEQLDLIQKVLHHLVNEEDIMPWDIVILTPRSNERTILESDKHLGNFTLCNIEPENALIFYPGGHKGGNIQVSSVYRFKGLERKVVILAEIDQSIGQQIDSVLYVGCSRARTHLILLMDENVPIEVKNKVDPVIKRDKRF